VFARYTEDGVVLEKCAREDAPPRVAIKHEYTQAVDILNWVKTRGVFPHVEPYKPIVTSPSGGHVSKESVTTVRKAYVAVAQGLDLTFDTASEDYYMSSMVKEENKNCFLGVVSDKYFEDVAIASSVVSLQFNPFDVVGSRMLNELSSNVVCSDHDNCDRSKCKAQVKSIIYKGTYTHRGRIKKFKFYDSRQVDYGGQSKSDRGVRNYFRIPYRCWSAQFGVSCLDLHGFDLVGNYDYWKFPYKKFTARGWSPEMLVPVPLDFKDNYLQLGKWSVKKKMSKYVSRLSGGEFELLSYYAFSVLNSRKIFIIKQPGSYVRMTDEITGMVMYVTYPGAKGDYSESQDDTGKDTVLTSVTGLDGVFIALPRLASLGLRGDLLRSSDGIIYIVSETLRKIMLRQKNASAAVILVQSFVPSQLCVFNSTNLYCRLSDSTCDLSGLCAVMDISPQSLGRILNWDVMDYSSAVTSALSFEFDDD